MNWQDILAIVLPLAIIMAWTYSKIEKKLDKMDATMLDINNRLTRLEGRSMLNFLSNSQK